MQLPVIKLLLPAFHKSLWYDPQAYHINFQSDYKISGIDKGNIDSNAIIITKKNQKSKPDLSISLVFHQLH